MYRVWKYERRLARLKATVADPSEAEEICLEESSNDGYSRVVEIGSGRAEFHCNALNGVLVARDLKEEVLDVLMEL